MSKAITKFDNFGNSRNEKMKMDKHHSIIFMNFKLFIFLKIRQMAVKQILIE